MSATTTTIRLSDYSLAGHDTVLAIEKGLAEATWYASPVPKDKMRELLQRRDGPALRDTILWFGLLMASGTCGYWLWQTGSWWAIVPFMIYGVIYGTTSASRWHESSHGTAFKTDWLNKALYEIASFMVMRESTVWRWSHTRHHSDTILVGRDPEIAVPRPPDLWSIFLNWFNLKNIPLYFRQVLLHATGEVSAEGKLIECPKHNGRFDLTDGSPQRPPVCVALKTHKVREHDGEIFLDLTSAGGRGLGPSATIYAFRVVSKF